MPRGASVSGDHIRSAHIPRSTSVKIGDRSRAEELATLRDVNRISRHVLQNLIVGSGVDWSQDATLLDLMLRLESAPLIDPPSSASASAG